MPYKDKEKAKLWREANKEKLKEKQKKFFENSPEKAYEYGRRAQLKRKYNLTEADYNWLCKQQKNVCAICGKKEGTKHLVVDHDHKTGKLRGLLCNQCNTGLGCFKDSGQLLTNATSYLRQRTNVDILHNFR